jgi:Xaa-Pro aminopeptidase
MTVGRVRRWLADSGYDGVLFRTQPEVAWVTGGLSDLVVRNEEPGLVWALVTADEAILLSTEIEAPRLRAEERFPGWELRTIPWYSPSGLLGLTGERKLLTDTAELAVLRMPLTDEESEKLGVLGHDCATALESALRTWRPDERECELAARIAAELEELLILPSVLLVGGAERRRLFRHPLPTAAVCGRDVLAVVVGVRGGLNVACSRSACAGPLDPELGVRHLAACAVEHAMISATRPGVTWSSVVQAGMDAYAAAGFPGEWRSHVQGGPIGYLSREFDVVPGTARAETLVSAGDAYAWNPTVLGAKSEDTFVVTTDGARPVTNTGNWPVVAGERPGILRI